MVREDQPAPATSARARCASRGATSWGWAGLAKVAPNPAVAEQLVRLRLDELDAEIAQVEADLSARRTALCADVASGIAVSPQHERALAELAVYFGWRVTVAICFGTVAVVLLVANLRELARD